LSREGRGERVRQRPPLPLWERAARDSARGEGFSRLRQAVSLVIAALVLTTMPLHAQTYPDRPVKIMVPSTPGGGFDFVGRVLGDKLTEQLGQPFVIENRAGAGTLVGTQAAAAAPPNGYTLLVGGLSNIALNAGL